MVLVGVTTLVFGAFQLHRSITVPFERDPDSTFKTTEQIDQEREAELKAADTDGDGLNDYDELYVFRTSPFLPDTDSDGYDDGIEIANANDPNCPAGKTCRQSALQSGSGSSSLASGGSGIVAAPTTGSPDDQALIVAMNKLFGDIADPTPEALSKRIMELPSADLREFLTVVGIPASVLDQADDATLRSLLAEALTQTAADPNVQNVVADEEAAAGTGSDEDNQ